MPLLQSSKKDEGPKRQQDRKKGRKRRTGKNKGDEQEGKRVEDVGGKEGDEEGVRAEGRRGRRQTTRYVCWEAGRRVGTGD